MSYMLIILLSSCPPDSDSYRQWSNTINILICPMPSSNYSMMLILLLHMALKITRPAVTITLILWQGLSKQTRQVAQSSNWVSKPAIHKNFVLKHKNKLALNLHSKLIRLPCLCYFNLQFENRLFSMYSYFVVFLKKATYFPICQQYLPYFCSQQNVYTKLEK